MKIRFLANYAGYPTGHLLTLKPGQESFGRDLIGRGVAEAADDGKRPQPAPEQAPAVETTTAEPSAEQAARPVGKPRKRQAGRRKTT